MVNKIMVDCINGNVYSSNLFKSVVYENKINYLIEAVPIDNNIKQIFKKQWGERRELPQVAQKSFNQIWRERKGIKQFNLASGYRIYSSVITDHLSLVQNAHHEIQL